jgi:hypothetical protein
MKLQIFSQHQADVCARRTLRDVRNEATTADMYENTGDGDKMSGEKQGFYMGTRQLRDLRQQSIGLLNQNA